MEQIEGSDIYEFAGFQRFLSFGNHPFLQFFAPRFRH